MVRFGRPLPNAFQILQGSVGLRCVCPNSLILVIFAFIPRNSMIAHANQRKKKEIVIRAIRYGGVQGIEVGGWE